MDEGKGDLRPTHTVHPRTRASLEEALIDEQAALTELVASRAEAEADQQELLDQLIARKQQIVAALLALRTQLASHGAAARPGSDDVEARGEEAREG